MSAPDGESPAGRVLVLAPTARDAELSREILAGAGIDSATCADLEALCRELRAGAGAALLTEESLAGPGGRCLAEVLADQPPWSDLPLLVMTGGGANSPVALRALETLGNVTLLERPVRVAALVSAVRAALRARRRQYQVRDHLAEREKAAAALREADRRKDEFLALLGHELRNPLAPIRNAVQLLELRPGDPAVVARARDMIARQSAQMTRLVDELLDASRIVQGKVRLRPERIDLAALVRSAAGDHRAGLEAAGLGLAVEAPEAPVWVRGDAVRLAQVVGNLLHNSQKFTDAGGRVTVRLAARGGRAVLTVEDTGIGVAPEALANLFGVFSQASASIERSRGGLGLGLAVVKGLAELHGGEVSVASAGLGKGASFCVSLPLERGATSEAAAPAAAPAAPAAGRRVLVVEDGEDAADSLRMLLELRGFDVSVARTGFEGIEMARRVRPDAVVCDLGLPGMSGFEVARALRADPLTAGALLVCLTGYGQDDDRRKALQAGFDAHLVKATDAEPLYRILEAGRPDA